jgi:hypothetical protein
MRDTPIRHIRREARIGNYTKRRTAMATWRFMLDV